MSKRQHVRISEYVRDELSRIRETEKFVKERLSKALEIAKKYSTDGKILCLVSRLAQSSASLKEHKVIFEIPVEEYIREPIGVGDYLAAVNISNLNIVLIQVEEIVRGDVLSLMGREPPLSIPPAEVHGILTPAQVKAQPIMGMRPTDGQLVHVFVPLEPQSPVFKPKPEVIVKCLGLPQHGILQGCMVTSRGRVLHDIPVRIPLEAFFQHVLMVGTTGSGKTTWIKNMILSMVHYGSSTDRGVTVVVFDATGEYIQMILPRLLIYRFDIDNVEEQKMVDALYSDVSELNSLIIILPVTQSFLDTIAGKLRGERMEYREKSEVAKTFGELIGKFYFHQTIGNIIKSLGGEIKEVKIKVRTKSYEKYTTIRRIDITFTANIGGKEFKRRLIILPWALEFRHLRERVKSLIPILTQQARYFFGWIIRKTEELVDRRYTTLKELRDDLARILGNKDERAKLELATQVSAKTIENMLRGLNLLIGSRLFDVKRRFLDPSGTMRDLIIMEPRHCLLYTSPSPRDRG